MAFAPTSIHIELTDDARSELERMARGQALPHRTVIRAHAVLAFADEKTVSEFGRIYVGTHGRGTFYGDPVSK